MESQKYRMERYPSNVSQIFQSLLDDALLRLIHFLRLVAQQLAQHEYQKFLDTAEARAKTALGLAAKLVRQTHLTYVAGHQTLPSVRSAPRTLDQTAVAMSRSSASSPHAIAIAMNDR